jgi:propionyl-CoA carboxylase beta chain
MFVTGPEVIKTVTHEEVTKEKLGGAETHNSVSGVAQFAAESDEDCLATIRELLSYMPSNNLEDPPRIENGDDINRVDAQLDGFIPESSNQPYEMRELIKTIADEGQFLEVHQHFARNLVVGFIRLNGYPVGIVANQPAFLAGVLDINASRKGARFVRFCDAFNIPLLVLEDVPGFLPGVDQEHGGIIIHGAKLLYALAEATVPKITVITRKAYGGAYCVMNSKHIRADMNFAYPTAEIAVMGAEGAVSILYRTAEDRSVRVAEYKEKFANPYIAAERGYIDEIIEPRFTRTKLITTFAMLRNKRDKNPPKKHGNIPL